MENLSALALGEVTKVTRSSVIGKTIQSNITESIRKLVSTETEGATYTPSIDSSASAVVATVPKDKVQTLILVLEDYDKVTNILSDSDIIQLLRNAINAQTYDNGAVRGSLGQAYRQAAVNEIVVLTRGMYTELLRICTKIENIEATTIIGDKLNGILVKFNQGGEMGSVLDEQAYRQLKLIGALPFVNMIIDSVEASRLSGNSAATGYGVRGVGNNLPNGPDINNAARSYRICESDLTVDLIMKAQRTMDFLSSGIVHGIGQSSSSVLLDHSLIYNIADEDTSMRLTKADERMIKNPHVLIDTVGEVNVLNYTMGEVSNDTTIVSDYGVLKFTKYGWSLRAVDSTKTTRTVLEMLKPFAFIELNVMSNESTMTKRFMKILLGSKLTLKNLILLRAFKYYDNIKNSVVLYKDEEVLLDTIVQAAWYSNVWNKLKKIASAAYNSELVSVILPTVVKYGVNHLNDKYMHLSEEDLKTLIDWAKTLYDTGVGVAATFKSVPKESARDGNTMGVLSTVMAGYKATWDATSGDLTMSSEFDDSLQLYANVMPALFDIGIQEMRRGLSQDATTLYGIVNAQYELSKQLQLKCLTDNLSG